MIDDTNINIRRWRLYDDGEGMTHDEGLTRYGHGRMEVSSHIKWIMTPCVMQPREEDDTCKETNIIQCEYIRHKINKRCTTNEKPKIYTHQSQLSLASSVCTDESILLGCNPLDVNLPIRGRECRFQ